MSELPTIVRSMSARMPWHVAQKIFKMENIAVSHGWDKTELKLSSTDFSQEARSHLIKSLHEHIVFGEKFVKYYPVTSMVMAQLRETIVNYSLPESRFRENYPYSLTEEEMQTIDREAIDLGLVPTSVEHLGDGVALVYCSLRVLTAREQLEPEDFPDIPEKFFTQFDELVGFKRKYSQAFDVIWIPRQGDYVEVLVDRPSGMTQDMAHAAHSKIKEHVNELVGEQVITDPVNLFPLIERMYLTPDEGKVVELGFSTTTGSVKQERMRRSSECLRRETYHVGGKAALRGAIEPFRVSIVWSLPLGNDRSSYPELSLNSTSRGVSAGAPLVNAATIRKCMGRADYEYVRSRVYAHLQRLAPSP